MKRNNYLYFIFGSFLLSSIVTAATFKDLNQNLLVSYFDKNVAAGGLVCALPPDKVAPLFQDVSIPVSQADCFVVDKPGTADARYIMKPTSSCLPEALHPKLKFLATKVCTDATKAVNAGGGGSGPGSAASGAGPKNSTTSALETVNTFAPVVLAAANVKKEIDKSGGVSTTASGAETTSSASGNSGGAIQNTVDPSKPTTATISDAAANEMFQKYYALKNTDRSKCTDVLCAKQTTDFFKEQNPDLSLDADTKLLSSVTKNLAQVDANANQTVQTVVSKENAAKLDAELHKNLGTISSSTQALTANASAGTAQINFSGCDSPDAEVNEFIKDLTTCSEDAARAANLCSIIRSPAAQAVQQLMTVATVAIGKMSSASETCNSTSNISQLAQKGMMLANLACTGVKFKCDFSCASAAKKYLKVQTRLGGVIACANSKIAAGSAATVGGAKLIADGKVAGSGSQVVNSSVAPTQATLNASIAQCQAHAADMLQFTSQIIGLATAAKQAKDCHDKLTAGGAGSGVPGAAPVTQTMDQMCAEAANAQMLVCKCKADANTVGCPGAVVKNKDPGGIIIKGGGKGSQLAGMNNFGQRSGLSPSARSALGLDSESGLNSDSKNDLTNSNGFGSAAATAGAGSGNAAGSGSSGSKNSDAVAAVDAKSKFNFGGFGGGLGGLFGGSKKSGEGSKFKDEKIAAAKRQIASQQLRSEISAASGKSNWDKVRSRYVESNSSFLGQ